MLNIKLHIYFFFRGFIIFKDYWNCYYFHYRLYKKSKNKKFIRRKLFLKKYIIYISEALNDELKDANKLYNED